MKKIFLMFSLIGFCQACSIDGYEKKRDFRLKKELVLGGKAIIVTKVDMESNVKATLGKNHDYGFTEMNWCRDEELHRCKEVLYFSPYTRAKFNVKSNRYHFYLADPGVYYLGKIKGYRGYFEDWYFLPIKIPIDLVTRGLFNAITGGGSGTSLNFNTRVGGWNSDLQKPNLASFEVKQDEIVYIGDLNFSAFNSQKEKFIGVKLSLVISDNYQKAFDNFRMEHPEYKNKKVVKRLAQPGVLLDNYDAGIFW